MAVSARFHDAVRGLVRHPIPTFLQVLVFACAFALGIAVVGAVEGGREQIRKTLFGLGVDVIGVLNPIQVSILPISIGGSSDKPPVDDEDIAALRERYEDEVAQVLPFQMDVVRVARDGASPVMGTQMAVGPGFARVIRSGLLAGRFLEDGDLKLGEDALEGPQNVVIDEALARKIDPEDPASLVGETLDVWRGLRKIEGHVVGVFRDPILLRKHLDAFDSQSSAREMPARRLEFQNVYFPYDASLFDPSGVLVQVNDVDDVERYGRELNTFFEARDRAPFYHVQKAWIDHFIDIADRFSGLAYFFWVVALAFLVVLASTVASLAIETRYDEIAIRRVEGATIGEVFTSLVMEGVGVALAAIPLGAVIAHLVYRGLLETQLGWAAEIPLHAWIVGPLLLIAVGAASYGIPARRVAGIDPARTLADWSR